MAPTLYEQRREELIKDFSESVYYRLAIRCLQEKITVSQEDLSTFTKRILVSLIRHADVKGEHWKEDAVQLTKTIIEDHVERLRVRNTR